MMENHVYYVTFADLEVGRPMLSYFPVLMRLLWSLDEFSLNSLFQLVIFDQNTKFNMEHIVSIAVSQTVLNDPLVIKPTK